MGGEGIPPYVVCGVKVLIFQRMLLLHEPHQTYEGSLMGLYGRVLSLLALMEETFEGLTRGSSVGRHTRVLYLVSRHSVLWHLRVQRSYPCVGAGGGHRS